MNSFIPWVGGKSKLLWIINKMAPDHYSRFIDVFGGSGTVTMSRPIQQGCMEVYNDFNSNLTNLFCCVKNRPLALLAELGFLPLNTRDDFNVLYKFLSKSEITDDYLQEEMELTEILLKPPEAEAIRTLLLERAPRGDVRRAADFFKLVRYSFSGSSKSFGGKPCDIRRFFHLIWECSRRLANVIVENKDFEDVIRQYDRGDAWIYCDPPYFDAESLYAVDFPKEKHEELHHILSQCKGYIVVSYNDCPFIRSLYGDFFILAFRRNNPLSQKAGATYGELIITNYDPRPYIQPQFSMFPAEIENGDLVLVHEPGCGSLREIYLRRREHETDKNDAPAGAGGEAGNGCELSTGSNGSNDSDGDRQAQYPLDQPPDKRGSGA